MAARTFVCPHCNGQNVKPYQLHLPDADKEGGRVMIAMGHEQPKYISCTECREEVETDQISNGTYDYREPKTKNETLTIVSVIATLFTLKFFFHWGLITTILPGCFIGLIVAAFVIEMRSVFAKNKAAGILLFLFFNSAVFSQSSDLYTNFLYTGKPIQWAAEYESFVHLSKPSNTFSLKNWYLQKLAGSGLANYTFQLDGTISSLGKLVVKNGFSSKALKNFIAEPANEPQNWWLKNKNNFSERLIPAGNFFSGDSCCGCDTANTFVVRQILLYNKGIFSLRNIVVSPLCLRLKEADRFAWYALGNFSFNTFAIKPADAHYVGSSEVSYPIDVHDSITNFILLTAGPAELATVVMKDIEEGRLIAFDYNSGKKIPSKQIRTWQMPVDTMMVYNPTTGKNELKLVHHSIEPAQITKLRIRQDFYFDTQHEKLFSIPRSVIVLISVYTSSGLSLGNRPTWKLMLPN